MSKDTICTLPWNGIHLNANIGVCCNSLRALNSNNGELSTAEDLLSLEENNDLIQLKKDLLAGVKNPICDRCWNMEPSSFRKTFNQSYPETYQKILTESPESLPLEHIFISIGNTCNLNCRMCGPHSSSMITKEWSDPERPHPVRPSNIGKSIIATDYDNTRSSHLSNPNFIEYVKNNYKELKTIYIYGGEPFIIIEEHLNFLQLLVDLGVSKNIKLQYSTNGTNTTLRRFIDLWKNFKEISISVSCDGMEEVYDFIRWPSTWSKMKKSLDYYYDFSNKNDNIALHVACTLQIATLEQIKKFENFLKTTYPKLSGSYYIPVDYPEEFSLKCVPLPVLKEYNNDPNLSERVQSIIKQTIDSYNHEESFKYFDNFLKTAEWQDKYRNQNVYDYLPQIKKWKKIHEDDQVSK